MQESELLCLLKRTAPIVFFLLFWSWETAAPYFGRHQHRMLHAGRNLVMALLNTLVLAIVFGAAVVAVAEWVEREQLGLLHSLSGPARWIVALVLLDGLMYLWHRANHVVPLLWRFHRTHHSDRHMDVSTATRFHLGEHLCRPHCGWPCCPLWVGACGSCCCTTCWSWR